jgi:hypothetical protein
LIRSIGRIPAERTTTYKILRLYDQPEEFPLRPSVQLQLAPAEKHLPYAEGSY